MDRISILSAMHLLGTGEKLRANFSRMHSILAFTATKVMRAVEDLQPRCPAKKLS
jgi:hypothetical protein